MLAGPKRLTFFSRVPQQDIEICQEQRFRDFNLGICVNRYDLFYIYLGTHELNDGMCCFENVKNVIQRSIC